MTEAETRTTSVAQMVYTFYRAGGEEGKETDDVAIKVALAIDHESGLSFAVPVR